MQEKLNLLFDITILVVNRKMDGCRSGIYFTAANILDEFYKREEFNLFFYCDKKLIPAIEETDILKKYDCPVINYEDMTSEDWEYVKLKAKRNKMKKEKKALQKTLMSILLFFFSLKMKLSAKTINLSKYDKINAFFSPCYRIPEEIRELKHIKKYTLLHDTIPLILPQYFADIQKGNSWYLKLVDTINKEDYYFTNSESTKRDFIKYVPSINPAHITTTLLACAETFKPSSPDKTAAALKKYNLPQDKKYIFSLCTLEPRKNLIRAVKCFIEFINKNNIDDLVFILGGGSWKGFIKQLEQEVPEFDKYRDKIIKAGYIDDEDLSPLYSGAEWFVYTSQYEGFGLPPLEAMSCGCPVITSNNSSLPEVVGDAGIMIDWDSDEQHIKAYENYYFNASLRKQNSQNGINRAKTFSWAKCVDLMSAQILSKNILTYQKENI